MRATPHILIEPRIPACGASRSVHHSLLIPGRNPAVGRLSPARLIRFLSGRALVFLMPMLLAGSAWAAPSISVIPNQVGREDTPVGPIDFTVSDPLTQPDRLVVSGSSTAPSIFPPGAFSFEGSGTNRTVTLRPATNAFGGATVTIVVSNGTQFASRSFVVQLAAVNDPPTLDSIPDQGFLNSGGGMWMYFSGVTAGPINENDPLAVTMFTNSNPGLFSVPPVLSYASPSQWGNVMFQPKPNVSGMATIGLQVDDGRGSNNLVRREFTVVVTNELVDLGVEGSYAYPYPAGVSNLLTYELRVYNSSVSDATGVVLTDVLPTNTIFLSASATTGGACVHVGRTVTCQLGRISRFQQAGVRILVLPTTTESLTNRVSVTSAQFDQYLLNNTFDMLTPVIRGMDLEITGADLPEAVLVGSNLTFSIQVTNHGLYTATNSAIQIMPAENFQVLSLVSSHGSCSNGPSGMGCALGNFAAGESAVIQLTMRPQRVGDVWIQVVAYSDSRDVQGNNNYRFSASVAARGIARATAGGAIQIPAQGSAVPYPSSLVISGLTSRVQRITVTLHGLTHPDPRDLDILLVGPDGRSALLLSDIEGTGNANDVTLTLDDFFPPVPADPIVSGRYAPTDYSDFESDVDAFPPPAPSGRPWTYLDVFRGSNPNGVWSLYIVDDSAVGGTGVLAGGWSLMLGLGDREINAPAHFRGIVASGNSGAGPGGKFTGLGRPVLNAAGQVAFVADVEITTPEGWTDSASGIWTASRPQDIRRLAGDRENPPGFGPEWQYQINSDDPAPALTDDGLLSFSAVASDPNQGIEYLGIWSGTSSNNVANLARIEGVVPGAGEDWFFREISRPYLSDAGVMAFRGRAESAFLGDSFTGYWIGSSRTNLALLARSGQPAPGVDGTFGEFEDFDLPSPLFDSVGSLAFRGYAQTDLGNTPGIWIGSSGQDLRLVAAAGTPIPGLSPGQSLRDGNPWLLFGFDLEGRAYFRADVGNDVDPGFPGILAGKSPDDLELLFRVGTPVFVGTNRFVFTFLGCPLVSPEGVVIFSAEFQQEDPGPYFRGIWMGRGTGDLKLVAYEGQPLPEFGDGAVLRDLSVDCPLRGVNRFSRFVFTAAIEQPFGEYSQALFVADPVVGIVPVARVGDIVEFAPTDFRRLTEIMPLMGPDGSGPDRSGGRRMINDASEVAFLAYFDNDTLGVVVSQLGSASVEGGVWYDQTANSVRDSAEPGVPQARVDLFRPGLDGQPGGGDDVLVASRLTDGDGHYRLGVMRGGQYFLQFSPPLGFGFVARDQGVNDSIDSDADPVTGRTAVFTLTATTQKTDLSAGLVSGFAVSDTQAIEGDSGQRAMIFTVTLGVPRRIPVSVSYATASGTAQSGVDFTPASGTLTFNPGESEKTVAVMVNGDVLLENDETVLLNLSGAVGAPIVRAQGAGRILNDEPEPPAPTQPSPPHRSVLQPLNVALSWQATRTRELLTNGGFEFDNFTGWTVEPLGLSNEGFFLLSDGVAAEGQFYAVSSEETSQPRTLSRRVLMPGQLRSARLRWLQSLLAPDGLGPNRRFRVEVRDESRQPLGVVYQSHPGDIAFEWVEATADLGAFGGRLIEIAFIVESPAFSLGVALDNIRLEVDDTAGTTFEVYFGTEPVPGAAQFRGTTASPFWTLPPLSPLTTYYWQIFARRENVAVPGPIWQFTTRRNFTNDFSHTFAALGEIVIPDFGDDGRAWPYPSIISVRNMQGRIATATVTLHGLSHSYPDDLDILLVGPFGQRAMLLSDAGGAGAVTGLTLKFDEAAAAQPSQAGPLRSGAFRPVDYVTGPDEPPLPAPAPGGPYLASLAQFGDLSPNGDWSLYVFDRFSFEDGGVIGGGWSLSLTLVQADTDGDGLPDDYETTNELNPLDSLDGSADLDGDGHTAGQEYLAGTNPDDPESVLRIRNFHFDGDDAVLEIRSGLGRDYRIERLDTTTGPGVVIATLPGGENPIIVRDFGVRTMPRAFYRIRAVPSAAPYDPDFPPGLEYFHAQAAPFTNSSFNRLFVVGEEARAAFGPGDTFTVEGRVSDQNDGSIVERFRIALSGVQGPGQFAIVPAGVASATYTRQPFPGPAFSYGTQNAGDGGVVLIDSLADGIATGRFMLLLSDTTAASRKIRVTGSFRSYLD